MTDPALLSLTGPLGVGPGDPAAARLAIFLDRSYCGRILNGPFSDALKERVIDLIRNFLAFDQLGNPAIPYVAAWHEHARGLWYEFASRRFTGLLGCSASEVANRFRQSVVDRSTYRHPDLNGPVTKEVVDGRRLFEDRGRLRREVQREGAVEAVYKIALPGGNFVWLKDQANVEIHRHDDICLSAGVLVDITKEMTVEEELKRMKRKLTRHRLDLEERIRERTRELRKTQLEIVYRLARAAEYRDNETGFHVTNMSRYCAVLGRAAGLTNNANRLLFHAAPMHDVGKIGISDRILLKPGRLNPQEFDLMKSHCTIGAELLDGHDSPLLKVARAIALTHHERWNGSGYPHGLSRDHIPLAGRITAVCDVFDALTSERPYKRAWPIDRAVAELKREKGSHFEPRLVDLFVTNLPAIKSICRAKPAGPPPPVA